MGGFRYVARTDRWEWSDEVARMYGYEPGAVIPTTELVLAHQHPKDRAKVAYLIEQVRRHGARSPIDTGLSMPVDAST
jgi:hypothetical protein